MLGPSSIKAGAIVYLYPSDHSGCFNLQHLQPADVPVQLWRNSSQGSVFSRKGVGSGGVSLCACVWQGKRGNIIGGLPVKPQPSPVPRLRRKLSLRWINRYPQGETVTKSICQTPGA